MVTQIHLYNTETPPYTSDKQFVSFINYDRAPMCLSTGIGYLFVSLDNTAPAYIYEEGSSVIISSKPLLSVPKSALKAQWNGAK